MFISKKKFEKLEWEVKQINRGITKEAEGAILFQRRGDKKLDVEDRG